MMKTILLTVTALIVSVSAFADGIAIVDAQKVINETNAAKRAMKSLKELTDEAQSKIDEMEAQLSQQRDELKRKKGVISEDKFLEEETALRRKVRDFRTEAQEIQENLDRENLKLRKEISDTVRKVVEEMAEKKKYDAVFASNMLLYADGSIDISSAVLKEANKRLDK